MDVKKRANELVDRIKDDPVLRTRFKNEPVQTIEELLGVDLPDDEIKKVVAAVGAKVGAGKLQDLADDMKNRAGDLKDSARHVRRDADRKLKDVEKEAKDE